MEARPREMSREMGRGQTTRWSRGMPLGGMAVRSRALHPSRACAQRYLEEFVTIDAPVDVDAIRRQKLPLALLSRDVERGEREHAPHLIKCYVAEAVDLRAERESAMASNQSINQSESRARIGDRIERLQNQSVNQPMHSHRA